MTGFNVSQNKLMTGLPVPDESVLGGRNAGSVCVHRNPGHQEPHHRVQSEWEGATCSGFTGFIFLIVTAISWH